MALHLCWVVLGSKGSITCRVADLRVVVEEPADINVAPVIPEDAVWKLTPTDPS